MKASKFHQCPCKKRNTELYQGYYFVPLGHRIYLPSVIAQEEATVLWYGFTESGGAAIRVVSVRIVGSAVSVHQAEIVGVAGIRQQGKPLITSILAVPPPF
jgi:hypothetical protein